MMEVFEGKFGWALALACLVVLFAVGCGERQSPDFGEDKAGKGWGKAKDAGKECSG